MAVLSHELCSCELSGLKSAEILDEVTRDGANTALKPPDVIGRQDAAMFQGLQQRSRDEAVTGQHGEGGAAVAKTVVEHCVESTNCGRAGLSALRFLLLSE